jgi:hypothetical protein
LVVSVELQGISFGGSRGRRAAKGDEGWDWSVLHGLDKLEDRGILLTFYLL